ncbi:MAG TPA: hypothetical protein VFJ19_05300 [Nocardioidaceae bacterium]|nr:hypothetical protein [Nocardioidaceae bacterium]
MGRLTRGPLPARIYWFRRVLVLALAFALVFAVGQLLSLGGDPGGASARTVTDTTRRSADHPAHAGSHTARHQTKHHPSGAKSTSAAEPKSTSAAHETPSASKDGKGKKAKAGKPKKTPLPAPTGPCSDDDVMVTPKVKKAHAGSPVVFVLKLRTLTATACNWVVSPRHLVVKLTSGNDRIWSSQDCPGAIPHEQVVVRREHNTNVRMAWNGQRSDSTCSRTTLWAQPGYYHVHAAALGANPTDVQFRLRDPVRPTITPSPTPRKQKRG